MTKTIGEKIMKVAFYFIAFVIVSGFAITTHAQDSEIKPSVNTLRQKPRILYLESLPPHTTMVNVKDSKKFKTPTIHILETPNKFRAELDVSFQEIREKWVSEHSDSIVIEVYSLPLFPQGEKYGVAKYVWVVDGDQNLNINLVRNGACKAKLMLFDDEDKKNILVDEDKYEKFERKILEAEKLAKKEKLGLWKK